MNKNNHPTHRARVLFLALHSRRLATEILIHDTIEYQSIKVSYSLPTKKEIKKLLY